jgi:hypothetical protein
MNKLKNIIANIPIYIGLYIRAVSDALFVLGFRTHITFKTESGLKLKEIDDTVKKLKAQVDNVAKNPAKKTVGEIRYSKLASIIKGTGDGSSSNS